MLVSEWVLLSVNPSGTHPCRALALNCDAPLNDKDGAESRNWRAGKPVRVVRSSKGRRISKYAPEEGNRYDGIYKVQRRFCCNVLHTRSHTSVSRPSPFFVCPTGIIGPF